MTGVQTCALPISKTVDLPLLGQVPLYPRVMEGGDTGVPIVTSDAESSAAKELSKIATAVAAAVRALTPA